MGWLILLVAEETRSRQDTEGDERWQVKIPCDKPIAGGILEQLIDAKINHLFNAEKDMVMARGHIVFKHWWMRGLKKKENVVADEKMTAIQKFKEKLRWDTDELWFDRHGVGPYATVCEPCCVRILQI